MTRLSEKQYAETVVVLPMPPSGNRLTRSLRSGGKPYPSPQYTKWKRVADGFLRASTPIGGWQRIDGPFTAEILLDKTALHNGDPDNRVKALLDYAQSRALIENDKHLTGLQLSVGEIPEGARLTLRAAA